MGTSCCANPLPRQHLQKMAGPGNLFLAYGHMWCSFGVSLHGVTELLSCDGRIFLGHATHSQSSFKNRRAINAAIAPTTKKCSHPMSLQRVPSLQLQFCFSRDLSNRSEFIFPRADTRRAGLRQLSRIIRVFFREDQFASFGCNPHDIAWHHFKRGGMTFLSSEDGWTIACCSEDAR